MQRPDLADELRRMADSDLSVRQRLLDAGQLHDGYHPGMRAVHRRNGDRLWAMLDELGGWPGFGLVGEDGSQAAFLIAQHDIANPALIRRSRDLYASAVQASDADPAKLANLEDRICYLEGRPQLFGTHVGWDEAGEFGPWPPVENSSGVDQRRAELGLGPLAEALEAAEGDRQPRPTPDQVVDQRQKADEFARQVGWRTGRGGPAVHA